MALNGLFCADVPLRNYSLTHYRPRSWNLGSLTSKRRDREEGRGRKQKERGGENREEKGKEGKRPPIHISVYATVQYFISQC